MLIFFNLSAHLESIQHNIVLLQTWPSWCGLTCSPVRLPSFSMDFLPRLLPCDTELWLQNTVDLCFEFDVHTKSVEGTKPFHYAISINCSALAWLVALLRSVVPLFSVFTKNNSG